MFGDNPLRLSKAQNPDIVGREPGENRMTALKAFGRLLWSPVRPSENWAQTLVRVAGNLLRWVIGLPIVVGLLGWGVFSLHSWWSDRPYRLTGLEGVEIGMTPTEVTLIKGAPKYITPILAEVAFDEIKPALEEEWTPPDPPNEEIGAVAGVWTPPSIIEGPDGQEFWFPSGTPDEVISATIREYYQGVVAIEMMSFDDIEVYFDRSSEGASLIARICLTQLAYSDGVIGIAGMNTEAEVIRHLGQPDSVSINDDGLSKWSSFERYNLTVRFKKARVYDICAGT